MELPLVALVAANTVVVVAVGAAATVCWRVWVRPWWRRRHGEGE